MDKFIPTDEQWEKMQKHIRSGNYKKEDFFVFETLAVGNKIIPNRYMRLMPDLLETMKEDAQKGVSLMLNHNWSQFGVQSIPIGKVFDARIDGGSQNGEDMALYTTQYILRDDSKVDGYSKNDIIKLIETGILDDTSIGWGTTREQYKCSICGHSIYDFENCRHDPGENYIVNEETKEIKQCIIEAHSPKEKHIGNNVLMENSIVFDGAYPNAVIQSAIGEEIETPTGKYKRLEGKVKLEKTDVVLAYMTAGGNVNLLYKPSLKKGGKENMDTTDKLTNEPGTETGTQPTETKPTDVKPTEAQQEGTTSSTNQTDTETVETPTDTNSGTTKPADLESSTETQETVYSVKQLLDTFGNIGNSLEELVTLAKEGKMAKDTAIAEALNSGVRAMGNGFNKEIFSKTFSNMNVKDINEMKEAWEKQVQTQFSSEKISQQKFDDTLQDEIEKEYLKQCKTDNY